VLCLNRIAGDTSRLPPHDLVDCIPVQRIPFLELKYYKPVILPVKSLQSADILHVHGIGAHLDFAAASRWIHHKPIVLSTHGGIFHNANLSVLKNTYFNLVRQFTLPRVDRIIACGEADRQLFADHGVTNTTVIDNGIDLTPFSEAGPESSRIPNRMLFVGRIAPNKCVEHLIHMLADIHDRGIPATLRIVGPDRYHLSEGLKRLAAGPGLSEFVTITGEIPEADIPSEYRQTDLFVSASRHEGFGISSVEAMAGGAIPLLNNIPAFNYLLKNSGPTPMGALCDFSDPSSAADAAIALLSADRPPVRDAARHRAADFSWNRLLPKWREVYDSV